jgi:tyrosine-protein kinase Etk/Wzc
MNQEKFGNDSIKLLSKVYKWRKPLILVTLSAAVVSTIVSFLISPQYLGTSIIFPARTFSVSKLLIEQNPGSQEDYMEYGDEDDCEKLLQILNSADIRNMAANEYNLWEHWKINKDDVYANHYLKLKWDEMVSFKRTDFVSIKINVYDYQSDRAAKIANSIVSYADSVKNKMTKVIAKEALMIIEEEYLSTLANIKSLEDSLQVIREIGVIDYKSEMEAYSKAMAKAVSKGDERAQSKLQVKLDILKKYGMAYQDLNEKLKKYRFKYPVIKGKYDEARVNFERHLPSKFVVEKAISNEKKAKPVRAIIVLVPTISTFLLVLLYLMFADKLIDIKKTIIEQSKKD